ncbi:hypothetical protein HYFRA_00000181 [Hymenoscyphus fraxineus]|uniref:Uncharacterized protein n=1 Tax=Hymenoscyphus fraxineus TaxID=746836 RepID=A0A9N9L3D0_9HELO|nr:hypothetical protein HYFRA_00000181 [Hymenoscyphus fraxineus]
MVMHGLRPMIELTMFVARAGDGGVHDAVFPGGYEIFSTSSQARGCWEVTGPWLRYGDDGFAQGSTAGSQLQGGLMTASWSRGVAMAQTSFDGRRGGGYGGLRIVLRRRLEVMAIGVVLPREYIFMSFPSVLNDSTCWELMPLNDEGTPHYAENLC